MKTFFAIAALVLTAGSAHAAPTFCNTNIDNDPRKGNTSIEITSVSRDRVSIRLQSRGGMAHFITAPRIFDAHAQAIGPEVVRYTNAEQGFDLEVVYQPIGGKIRGTLNEGKLAQPVACVMAVN